MGPTEARVQGGSAGGDDSSPRIRPAVDGDAATAASLHATRIDQGFLSSLGAGFLTRLYRRIVRSPESFLLVAEATSTVTTGPSSSARTGSVVGFIAGTTDLRALYRSFLLHDGIVAGLVAAPRLVRNWRRVTETLGHGSDSGAGAAEGTELLAVAVDPVVTGRGVGLALVEAFLQEVDARGLAAAHVVVGADNDRAVALYGRAGFTVARKFELHAGTRSLLMQWHPVDGATADDSEGVEDP